MLSDKEMKSLVSRLGKEKDIDLAEEYNITRQRISAIRKSKGIPPFKAEFRSGNRITITSVLTKADERDMKKAMKKVGEKNRSRYIRDSVRKNNREVLT